MGAVPGPDNGMAAPLLSLRDIRLTFGGPPLLAGADLVVAEGERLCLVGRNGSGKSTLLRIAAGLVEADAGERVVRSGVTIRYLAQEPDFSGFTTTLAAVEAGLTAGDASYRASYLLETLGLDGTENPTRLSGGEARRVALARALAPEPDILLLDEPTNHLDLPAIEWLEAELKGMRSALVLISHDRRFLENLSQSTLWIDRGATRRIDRGFSHFEAWRDEILEQEERDQHKLDRKIVMEMDWLRYGVTGRRKRNQRRLGDLHAMRQQRRGYRGPTANVQMSASESEISGKLVIEAKASAKAWGDRVVVRDFSIRIARGDRIGIVGPNGAGKTTLLGLLTGATKPDSGVVRLGHNLDMVTLDQKREALDPAATLIEAMTGGAGDQVMVNGQPRHVQSYMKDFLFTPEQGRTPVGVLSGGERGRLMLARALAQPSNLMVLDEPTNDLDLETLDLLEEMLSDYPGTLLVVSHDRDFLDRVATSIIVAEAGGRWQDYAGGYSDMVAQRGQGVTKRVTQAASGPGKIPSDKLASDKIPTGETGAEFRPSDNGPGSERRKLTFKDKHALATLPDRIEALQRDIAKLQAKLAEPDLFSSQPALFAKVVATLDASQAEIARCEDEWLALSMLEDELQR
jgi:ATP-binding cassette subfamily F protein uup